MAPSIEIDGHRVGRGHPCYVIAEVGVNHNGDLSLAHRLVDAAVAAGADAVKFQTFSVDGLTAPDAPQAAYQRAAAPAASQAAMLAGLVLDEAAHRELKAHADGAGITFLSSPFDESALALLMRIGVPAIKVASGEVTNHPFLRQIGATGLPIVMSTGMCTLDEVDAAIEVLGPARDRLAVLHCVSTYPAVLEDCNLRVMESLRTRYDVPVGWSDHTEGTIVAAAAVALGADIVEKHITLDRGLPGPDHRASIEPSEFAAMVAAIRTVQSALGDPVKRPTPAESEVAAVARKSLHWRRALPPGRRVAPGDLVALRPGTGLPPSRIDELIGRTVLVATVPGTMARLDDVGPAVGGSTA